MGEFTVKFASTDAELAGKGFVHYQAWNEAYTGLIPQAYLDSRSLSDCRQKARSGTFPTLVAIADGQVAGFANFIPESREFVSVPDSCEVVALYVLEKFQRRGIGSTLMERCMAELPEGKSVVLFVLEGNEKAIRFYRKHGFVFTGSSLTEQVPGGEIRELEMVKRAAAPLCSSQ